MFTEIARTRRERERESEMRDKWEERERRKRQNESKMKNFGGGLWAFFLWVCILAIFVPPLDIISSQFFPIFIF